MGEIRVKRSAFIFRGIYRNPCLTESASFCITEKCRYDLINSLIARCRRSRIRSYFNTKMNGILFEMRDFLPYVA